MSDNTQKLENYIPTHYLQWMDAEDNLLEGPCAKNDVGYVTFYWALFQWWHEKGNFKKGEWRNIDREEYSKNEPPKAL